MKNVIIFCDNEWALGSIHTELVKQFFTRDINASLLNWGKTYTLAELLEMNDSCDYILTTPHGYITLRSKSHYQIPQSKFIVVAHATLDLTDWVSAHGVNESLAVKSFGVVSTFLQEQSKALGFPRQPELCELGVNFNTLYAPVSSFLDTVGYASTYWGRNEMPAVFVNQPAAKKRAYLAKEATEAAGLNFKIAQKYHNSFITMAGFYRNIDALIMSSSEEGAGLPVLEAGAAGRLVISTPVGHVVSRLGSLGADLVPIDEPLFHQRAVELLSFYKLNSSEYQKRCKEIQEHAREYDWSKRIQPWMSMFD